MSIHYAIVEGDPLTSGGNSHVIGGNPHSTIEGPDGRIRNQAHIGHKAWCAACQSIGVIVEAANLKQSLRGYDEELRAYEAVDDDKVICKCSPSPRLIARYGRLVSYHDYIQLSQGVESARTITPIASYDEQFALHDAKGAPLPNTYYTARLPSGALVHGTTDAQGLTARHATDRASSIQIYLGHREQN